MIVGALILVSSACGVKGPPLPPVADTPAASDRPEISGVTSTPAPVMSPVPSSTPKRKKRR